MTDTVVARPFATLVTAFFREHLAVERNASSHTIRSYRDTFRFLLRFVIERRGLRSTAIEWEDITPEAVLAFLEQLEKGRGNSSQTRNVRFAAIRAFFWYVNVAEPPLKDLATRILGIPFKRVRQNVLGYLSEEELSAILAAPNRRKDAGRKDYLAIALLYDTGARAHELVAIRPCDLRLDRIPWVKLFGKGKKERIVPLTTTTAKLVREAILEQKRSFDDTSPLVRNRFGQPMTTAGLAYVVEKYRAAAAGRVPSLAREGISPHTFRHTKAMLLFDAGIPQVTIKDILGHASLRTLGIYVQASVETKRKALEAAGSPVRVLPAKPLPKGLLEWLEQL